MYTKFIQKVNSISKFSWMYMNSFDCSYLLLFTEFLDFHSKSENRHRAQILNKEYSEMGAFED